MFVTCLLVAGCASVPSTKFTIDPKTGVVTLDSPKNVHAEEIEVTLPNGTRVRLKGYGSTNSPDAIAAVALGNAEMAGKLIDAMKLLESMAAKSAMASPPASFQRPSDSDVLPLQR